MRRNMRQGISPHCVFPTALFYIHNHFAGERVYIKRLCDFIDIIMKKDYIYLNND